MKKYFLIVIILFIGCQKEVVQETDVDRKSINSELFDMLNNNDSLRIHTFSEKLENFNINASEKNALRDCIALHHYKEKFNHDNIGRLSWNHIDYLYNNGYEDVSLYYARYKFNAEFLNKTLPNFLTKIDSALVMFSNLKSNCQYANLYQLKITYLMAKSYNNLALKEMQKILRDNEITENCPDIKFSVYMEMSFMYADLKLTEKSLESAYKSLSYAENASDKAISNSLIAKAYLGLNQTEKGLDFINEALALEVKSNSHMLNYYRAILLEMYVELGKYNKSDALFEEYESSVGFLNYHHYLFCRAKAKSLKKRKMYAASINYYVKAKSFIPEEKLIQQRIILKDLSDVYALNGNLKEAIFYLNEYQKREEQFTKQQNEDLINEQTVALKVAENEAELLKTREKAVKQELKIAQKNKTISWIILITLFLLFSTLTIYYFFIVNKTKNTILQNHKIKIEQINIDLNRAIQQKEILIREIHHRVKNNLQLIISMLNIQARRKNYSNIYDFIENVETRIHSMALIHQSLYQSEEESDKINFQYYLQNLVNSIKKTFEVEEDHIVVNIAVNEIFLNLITAIPIGLIVNELISNSFKYAFPNNRKGEIFVAIKKIENNKFCLIVEDDGIGCFVDLKGTKTFGKELVHLLANQLKGNVFFENNNGAKYKIFFEEFNS